MSKEAKRKKKQAVKSVTRTILQKRLFRFWYWNINLIQTHTSIYILKTSVDLQEGMILLITHEPYILFDKTCRKEKVHYYVAEINKIYVCDNTKVKYLKRCKATYQFVRKMMLWWFFQILSVVGFRNDTL